MKFSRRERAVLIEKNYQHILIEHFFLVVFCREVPSSWLQILLH